MLEFSGTLVPLVCPFTDDMSSVSEVRLARLVRLLVQNGVQGFAVGSDAAEFGTLSHAERKFMLEVVLRESQGAVPVIVNATSLSTMSALDLGQHAARHGARAVMMIPPFYGRYTLPEIQRHLKMICDHSGAATLLVANPEIHPDELFDEVLHHRGLRKVDALSERWPSSICSSPYPTTDEFCVADFVVSPLGLIDHSILTEESPAVTPFRQELAQTMRKFGVTRVVKTILNLGDAEIGPPRTPMQPLEREDVLHLLDRQAA